MTWTDERVETLKTMWSDGKSASQIAKELGGITRNAVIGKVHRLGLSNRAGGLERPEDSDPEEFGVEGEVPVEPDAPVEVAPGASSASRPSSAEPAPEAPPAARTKLTPLVAPNQPPLTPPQSEISPEALANLAEIERKAKRLSLMQLTERTCKWPVGDPATDDFWFCGLPAIAGKPYCDAHGAVAFQPMSSRRDRRAGGR